MFDLARFRLLLATHWAENARSHAWFLGIGVLVHALVLLFAGIGDNPAPDWAAHQFQQALYVTGLMITGTIFAARHFAGMARPESALVMMMRPAASTEKWLLAVVVVAIGYPLAYSLAFQVCNVAAWLLAAGPLEAARANVGPDQAWLVDRLSPENFRLFLPWQLFTGEASGMPILLSFWSLQGFALAGSLWFARFAALKTFVAGFLVFLGSLFIDSALRPLDLKFFEFWSDEAGLTPLAAVVYAVAWFGVPLLLWLSGLAALRERQLR